MQCLRAGNRSAAGDWFEEAVRHDPTAADAWLGVHATERRRGEAVTAMNWHAATFGELRSRHGMPLKSRFDLGHYVTFRLETPRDLWLARMADLLSHTKLDEVGGPLSTAVLDCDETRFVCTRYAFLKNDWNQVLTFARGIQDGFMTDESQLYVARALIEQQVFHAALDTLAPLPTTMDPGARFEGEVAYLRGQATAGLGREDEALRHYQHSYRLFPDLGDVAQRARAKPAPTPAPPTPPVPVAPPPAPPTAPPAPGAPATDAPGTSVPPQQAGTAEATGAEPTGAEAREEILTRALAALDDMTGLAPVKRQIRTLVAQLRMAALRAEQGLPAVTRPHHFVFAGPPGTGKTTVARIVGEVFNGLGLLEQGHLIEAHRVDLVGQHLGETAIKTSGVIDRALDGVLFIDEAYALSNTGYSGGDAFGKEALQVLLKRAEDDRDRLVVILVGYQDEIAELLSSNPGLASRFTTRVEFPAYSADELLEIAGSFLAANGDVLADEARTALETRLGQIVDEERINTLGNGRFVRELCLKAAALRDLRLADAAGERTLSREEITTLLFDDINAAYVEVTNG
ncbi:AAA family ATPase [Streptomyces sp. YC537]|uniref:AAA family ATPase n=2 Tax=Streptomyces boluensis TaxID=1775135 RepID=A0A964XN24_9ACTN|nr:AAA family ATPase [Streptomyces boluensis]